MLFLRGAASSRAHDGYQAGSRDAPFYGRPSRHLGTTPRAHATLFTKATVASKETPWRPALYALGQHDALLAAQADLQEGEFLAAFLDDLDPA